MDAMNKQEAQEHSAIAVCPGCGKEIGPQENPVGFTVAGEWQTWHDACRCQCSDPGCPVHPQTVD